MDKIEFLTTERGNIYAVSKEIYKESLAGSRIAISYINSLKKYTDENSHS